NLCARRGVLASALDDARTRWRERSFAPDTEQGMVFRAGACASARAVSSSGYGEFPTPSSRYGAPLCRGARWPVGVSFLSDPSTRLGANGSCRLGLEIPGQRSPGESGRTGPTEAGEQALFPPALATFVR